MKFTTTRYRDPVPRHAVNPHWITDAEVAALAGKSVRILLPPLPNPGGWHCETALVWEVHADDVPKGMLALTLFVCEHQVELD